MPVDVHDVSEIVPAWPFAVADEPLNAAVPKSASGNGRHDLRPHRDGASAIHSADEMSSWSGLACVLKVAPVVTSVIASVTRPVLSETSAEIVSPADTCIVIGIDAAGSSSYQTEYTGRPLMQSDSVPICSSPLSLPA